MGKNIFFGKIYIIREKIIWISENNEYKFNIVSGIRISRKIYYNYFDKFHIIQKNI